MRLRWPPWRAESRAISDDARSVMARAVAAREGTPAGAVSVTQETALRHSAVWAALVLRADLISSMPVDVTRSVSGRQVSVSTPPVLVQPAAGWSLREWLWASQFDLDRHGNSFGIVTARDGFGLPAQVEPVAASSVSVLGVGSRVTGYRVDGTRYEPQEIWHERQYRPNGCALGLSPIAYAAYSIGGFLSAQEFALNWFENGAVPSVILQNELVALSNAEAEEAKSRYMASVSRRDVTALGKGWKVNIADTKDAQNAFLDEMKFGIVEVARFFRVPADLIDGAVSGENVTYANIAQRNLQLLIMNLGPAKARRDDALSRLVPSQWRARLNQDAAVLQMDPETRSRVLGQQIQDRIITPDEAREKLDREPYTESDYAQFDRLFRGATTWEAPA